MLQMIIFNIIEHIFALIGVATVGLLIYAYKKLDL